MTTRKYLYSVAFQNEAERLAYVPLSSDQGKVALQLSDGSYWEIKRTSPIVWERMGSAAPGPGGWRQMIPIFDKAVIIPATPDAVLMDEEINLAPWGLVATTSRNFSPCWLVEKPDGNGGWVGLNKPENRDDDSFAGDYSQPPPTFAFTGPDDPDGYEFGTDFIASPMKRPHLPGGDPAVFDGIYYPWTQVGQDVWFRAGAAANLNPGVAQFPGPNDMISRLRVIVKRSSVVYSPEDQARIDAYGYRVRIIINAINMVAWEKEVPITPNPGDLMMAEELWLSDYGLNSDHDRFCFIAEFRRNGKTIRPMLSREYAPGEDLDPPTHPVAIKTCQRVATSRWWNDSNTPADWVNNCHLYGKNGTAPRADGRLDRGTWVGPNVGYCSESQVDRMVVAAWRVGYAVPAYYDGSPRTRASVIIWGAWPFGPGTGLVGWGCALRATVTGGDGEGLPVNIRYHATDPVSFTAIPGGGINIVLRPNSTTMQQLKDGINSVVADSKIECIGVQYPDRPCTLVPDLELVQGPFTLTMGEAGALEMIPPPEDPSAGCTLRMRLLVAPPNRLWEYPFEGGGDRGLDRLLLRGNHSAANPPAEGLWLGPDSRYRADEKVIALAGDPVVYGTYTTETRPPLVDGSFENRIICVKDPGVDAVYQICRLLADNSYEWVAVPLG